MNHTIRSWSATALLLTAALCIPDMAFSCEESVEKGFSDTLSRAAGSSWTPHRFVHKLSVETRPGYVFPTNSFLKGGNAAMKAISNYFSGHLKYAFGFHPDTYSDRIYGGAYQGIGLGYFNFGNKQELGNPPALYLFQGAHIAQFSPRLSFNYEWNFGLSWGWVPFDYEDNPFNGAMGSRINAYISAQLYLNWMLSQRFDLTVGADLSHFSNGNTYFPNAGLNTLGLKVGLTYNFNRTDDATSRSSYASPLPEVPRHISYDFVMFGSWKRKGVVLSDRKVVSSHAYPVGGFNFAPMYNFGYRLRAGLSVDGVYDGSANVYAPEESELLDESDSPSFLRPSVDKQLSLGVSARGEYVMPYFTLGIGLGVNVLHGGDLNGFYQILALKMKMTRNSFLHIGYNLQNFHTPNYLMLGIGFRFNNKYPSSHR